LLVIGDGALEDDIDVQAAKTDIAASDAATIGPAVRVRETDAMVGFLLRGGRTYYRAQIGRRRPFVILTLRAG
jgi:hypothetical protein